MPPTGPTISIIAAMTENRVIGKDGQLPWRLPDEMKHFVRLTTGNTVVMGRRTFESIGSKALPNRRNIILSRDPGYAPQGVEVASGIDELVSLSKPGDEVFICGGEQAYRDALPIADRLYLTVVHAELPGDTHFPVFNISDWRLTDEVHHDRDAKHIHAFTFRHYDRQRPIRD